MMLAPWCGAAEQVTEGTIAKSKTQAAVQVLGRETGDTSVAAHIIH